VQSLKGLSSSIITEPEDLNQRAQRRKIKVIGFFAYVLKTRENRQVKLRYSGDPVC
jgi:hypothetical protein